jgi:uncharacterized protein YjbI with pentapeptide repeats
MEVQMVEIRNRFTEAVIYRSENAQTIAGAIAELIEKARAKNSRANLSEANLSEANLSEANLSEANLSGANLRQADLSEADLSGANLRQADLSEADLSFANLRQANLSGANLVSLGFDHRGYHFFLYYENDRCVIRAGCRIFNVDDARRHWANKPEVLARLDLAEAIAKNRGWNLRKEN